jgi:hypothetical protein
MEILGISWGAEITDPGNDLVYFDNYLNGPGDMVTVDPNLSGAHSVVAADFDRDGDNDVIASGGDRIKLYRNDGGAFASPKELSRHGALCVNVYDIDGDGDLDLLTQGRNPPNQHVYWWEQTSPLSFTQRLIGTDIGECWAIHAGDLDGDGDQDVIAASQTFRTIRAYLNDGSQQFTEFTVVDNFGNDNGARYAIAMDVDGDGDADVIGAAPGARTIAWFESISEPASSAPQIASFSPGSGPTGIEVAIIGANFIGATEVAFNGVPAPTFFVDSNTQIRATVPDGATTGKIRVTTGDGAALSADDFTVTTGGGSGATLTFTPLHDAYVKSSSAGENFGNRSTLRLRKSSSEMINTYLKFEVNGLSGTVQSAKLRLYVTDAGPDGGTLHVASNSYNGSSTPWTQGGVNWNNAPELVGAALGSAGSVSAGNWLELEVTSAITGDGTYSFGLQNNSSNTVYYSSKEGVNKPELVIDTGVSALAAHEEMNDARDALSLPKEFLLNQNYPNPFNPETQITFDLPDAAFAQLKVFDVLGREVITLVKAELPAGHHQITWDGRDASGLRVSSGVYFYQLQAGSFRASRRMLLVQ